MPRIGDKVRYLNSVGGGTIVRIADNIAYVDEDGFETPVLLKECVVVGNISDSVNKTFGVKTENHSASGRSGDYSSGQKSGKESRDDKKVSTVASSDLTEDIETEETGYGDKMTVVLGIESIDIANIGESGYEASLVNDSNYHLYFTWLTRKSQETDWTARYAGTVEPNIQVVLSELSRQDVSEIDVMAVQFIAFKRGKPFPLQQTVSTEFRVDSTKFFKVHCFRDNTYFGNKVLAFDVVRDGIVSGAKDDLADRVRMLDQAMRTKQRLDRQTRRPVRKRPEDRNAPLVTDLHISELVDSTAGMSNADMLNLQIDTFRRIMDENLRNHGRKLIFIHGKGEGVLRQALYKELNYRYKGHDVCDASFREYGYGATQVTIH